MRLLNPVNGKNFLLFFLMSYLMLLSVSPNIPLGTVAAEFIHNITVFNVVANVTAITFGDDVGISVDVGNQGDFAETFDVTIYYRNATVSYQAATTTVPMEARTNTTLDFVWDTTGVAEGSYEITANATIVPSETDPDDNSLVADETVVITSTMVLVDLPLITADPGDSFTIDVTVQDVVDLYSYGVRVSFDGAVLEAVNIEEGPFLKAGGTTFFSSTIEFNRIYVTCAFLGIVPGVNGSGTLFNATLTVRESGESNLTILPTPGSALVSSALESIPFAKSDGKFYTTLPSPKYAYSPTYDFEHPENYGRPIVGETVTFNASASYDPDDPYDPTPGGIVSYKWDFGDGNTTTVTGPTVTHVYTEPNPYLVILNVTDDDDETNIVNHPIIGTTIPVLQHDIAVINVTVTPTVVSVGSTVTINVTVLNEGSSFADEWLNVTVYANMQPVQTKLFDYLIPPSTTPHFLLLGGKNETTTLTWDTTGMPPSNYTISVEAYLVYKDDPSVLAPAGIEQDLYDNGMFYGSITLTEEEANDLAITDVEVVPTLLELDDWSSVQVTVENRGTVDEHYNATITIQLDSSVVNTKSWSNETLNSGTTVTLKFPWLRANKTTKEGEYNFTAKVQLVNKTTLEPPSYEDANLTNNILSIEVGIYLKPKASFTYSPGQPLVDQTVTFNATASYAPGIPNGTITEYSWEFGDGTSVVKTSPIATHVYRLSGRYTVNLLVTDDSDQTHFAETEVTVSSGMAHILMGITFSPSVAMPGQSVSVSVTVRNVGYLEETFNVTAYYNENKIGTETGIALECGANTTLTFTWDTAGVPHGYYTIKMVASKLEEGEPVENTYIGGTVAIGTGGMVPTSNVTISASPPSLNIGASTVITGSISPASEAAKVWIKFRLRETETWSNLSMVITDQDGNYAFTWEPRKIGLYALKSIFLSEDATLLGESKVEITEVKESAPLNIFIYTTIGLAAGLAAVIASIVIYLVKVGKRKPE